VKNLLITCKTEAAIDIGSLTELQGGLKKRSQKDIDKIKRSINKHGFATPFFVWKDKKTNYVLDGHGRLEACKQIRDIDGVDMPPLPVVYVECKNKADAKNLLLKITSQYGKVSPAGLDEFIEGLPDFVYDDVDLRFEKITVFNQDELEKNLDDCGLKFPVVIAQDQSEYNKLQQVKKSLGVFSDENAIQELIENALREIEKT